MFVESLVGARPHICMRRGSPCEQIQLIRTQMAQDQAEMNSLSRKSEAAQALRQQESTGFASPSGAQRSGRRIVML